MHRAAETDPIQEFLLPGILDLRRHQLAPARHFTRGQLVETGAVAGIVGVEIVVFRRQKGVRPARRGNERDAPGAVGKDARDRAADIETAPRVGSGGIDQVRVGVAGQMRGRAAFGDHRRAVAVHMKRHDRVREPGTVIVEIEDRVDKRMRQPVFVAHAIGVAGVVIGFDQLRRQGRSSGVVAFGTENGVLALVPDIAGGAGVARIGARLDLVAGEDAERRHPVLAEILVLVVTPDQHEIGIECVQRLARLAKAVDQPAPVLLCGGERVGPFLAHRLGPAHRVLQRLGDLLAVQRAVQQARHLLVGLDQTGVMRNAYTENLAHPAAPPVRGGAAPPVGAIIPPTARSFAASHVRKDAP
ncbi:MAG: hypothetical protein AB7O13_10435 [Alphaproteobacteria bacterium]